MKAQIWDRDTKKFIMGALVCAFAVGTIASVATPASATPTTCYGVGEECKKTLDVNVIVPETISLNLTPANTGGGSAESRVSTSMLPNSTDTSMVTTAQVATNSLTGAVLTVIDADSSNALVLDNNNNIQGIGGAISAGTSKWNLTVTGATQNGTTSGTSTSSFVSDTAVPASTGGALELYRHAQPPSDITASIDDTVTIRYNVSTSSTQASGTYTDTITYTASTI